MRRKRRWRSRVLAAVSLALVSLVATEAAHAQWVAHGGDHISGWNHQGCDFWTRHYDVIEGVDWALAINAHGWTVKTAGICSSVGVRFYHTPGGNGAYSWSSWTFDSSYAYKMSSWGWIMSTYGFTEHYSQGRFMYLY